MGRRANTRGASLIPDLLLIGGVTTERRGVHPAQDNERSPLFNVRKAYAEATGKPWLVLSTRYGLVAPAKRVRGRGHGGTAMNAAEGRRWAQQVLRQLNAKYGSLTGRIVEIHAGLTYHHPDLMASLAKRGLQATVPLEGISLSRQIAWYKRRLKEGEPR